MNQIRGTAPTACWLLAVTEIATEKFPFLKHKQSDTSTTSCVDTFFTAGFCLSAVPSVLLALLVGHQEEHLDCKKLSDGVLAWLFVWNEMQMICMVWMVLGALSYQMAVW